MDNIFAIGQMDTSTSVIIVTTLCSTVAGLVMSVLGYMRESRAHKWVVEQARQDRQERLLVADDVKRHTESTTKVLSSKIDDNTDISVAAFKEANDVNRKIQQIGEMRLKSDAIRAASHDLDLKGTP